MKAHHQKKLYRAQLHKMAKEGLMNDPEGRMVPRDRMPDNSMKQDYYPQQGKK